MLVDYPAMEMERILALLKSDGWIYMRLRQHSVQRLLYLFWRIIGRHLKLPNPSVYHPYNFTPGTIRKLAGRLDLEADISNAPFTAGDPYSALGTEFVAKGVKFVGGCAARVSYYLSGGSWIMSPGMDIWMQRKVNRKTP